MYKIHRSWVEGRGHGPTVYALYQYYGYSRADNGLLFIVGFGSSDQAPLPPAASRRPNILHMGHRCLAACCSAPSPAVWPTTTVAAAPVVGATPPIHYAFFSSQTYTTSRARDGHVLGGPSTYATFCHKLTQNLDWL
jgi:hypothetical protein